MHASQWTRAARRWWAKLFIGHDLLEFAATTQGHCAQCDHADTLLIVRRVWPICLDCYIDFKAGLIKEPSHD